MIKHRVVVESPAEVSGKGLLCVRLILRPTRRQRRQRRRRHRRRDGRLRFHGGREAVAGSVHRPYPVLLVFLLEKCPN